MLLGGKLNRRACCRVVVVLARSIDGKAMGREESTLEPMVGVRCCDVLTLDIFEVRIDGDFVVITTDFLPFNLTLLLSSLYTNHRPHHSLHMYSLDTIS